MERFADRAIRFALQSIFYKWLLAIWILENTRAIAVIAESSKQASQLQGVNVWENGEEIQCCLSCLSEGIRSALSKHSDKKINLVCALERRRERNEESIIPVRRITVCT